MVHTISGITLHRLRRMAASGDAPYESRVVIGQMVDLVRQVDPFFFEKVGCDELPAEALPETGFPRPRAGGDAFAREFDGRLDGKVSRLTDFSPSAEQSIAESVRVTFGLTRAELDDDEAIDRVLNPAKNRYRLEVMNVSYHSPLMRSLHHASYTFEKRLSHTADSQDQRHRMVPASRPLMSFVDTKAPDYVTPRLIAANPQAMAAYDQRHARGLGRQEPAARPRRAARVRALRAAEREDAAGSWSRDRSSPCSTSGRCGRASTRRKRSTWRRWTS